MAAPKKSRLDLFAVSLPICAVVALWGVINPEGLAAAATAMTRASFRALDWFYIGSVSGLLLLCLWLGFGRHGDKRLGGDDEEAEFSIPSWLSMLFAAGMGVGLLFWGVAEPMSHFSNPPIGEGGDARAARDALVFAGFHWGLHAWGVYCLGSLALAYFGFRHKQPYLSGTPIRFAFRGRWVEPVAKSADLIAVLAVAFGVAGSLGTGVLQLHTGLHLVLGVPMDSQLVALGILALLMVSYITSASTSLDKGIQLLSNLNMALAILLLIFLMVVGPTSFLLSTFVTSVGDYFAALPRLSLSVYPFTDTGGWHEGWTLTNFSWWIAWAPFVGVFIARISRGRTLREFVLGVLFVPSAFSAVWFAVFGGTGMHEEMFGGGGIATLVQEDVTAALFALYDRLPGAPLLGGLSLVLVFVFLVTSVDSATFVLGMLTSRGDPTPTTARKVAWGVSIGVLGAALVLSGNMDAVRAVAVLGAIPFSLILLLHAVALVRTLAADDRGEIEPPPPPDDAPPPDAKEEEE